MKKKLHAAEPVSAYNAKTHLPSLLERTAAGEQFVITRHGKPVARLVPYEVTDNETVRTLINQVSKHRKTLAAKGIGLADILVDDESARELSHAGHRY